VRRDSRPSKSTLSCVNTPCDCALPSHAPLHNQGVLRADGSSHGVLLLNSNGMEIVPGPDSLSFRAIGGVLDFYIFAGPTPAAVLEQLTAVVGRPYLPPYWSMGLMNSKCAGLHIPARPTSEPAGHLRAALPGGGAASSADVPRDLASLHGSLCSPALTGAFAAASGGSCACRGRARQSIGMYPSITLTLA